MQSTKFCTRRRLAHGAQDVGTQATERANVHTGSTIIVEKLICLGSLGTDALAISIGAISETAAMSQSRFPGRN